MRFLGQVTRTISRKTAVLIFFAAMTLVFTGTVLFPLKNLRKMKIAEQIKYE